MADIRHNTAASLEGMPRLKSTRPRARRYRIIAPIEMTDLQTERQIRGRTRDLSLYGCNANTETTLPTGTRVRIRIIHGGGNFISLGRVVYVKPSVGIGVVFTKVEHDHELVLERWIAELRNTGA